MKILAPTAGSTSDCFSQLAGWTLPHRWNTSNEGQEVRNFWDNSKDRIERFRKTGIGECIYHS